MSDITTKPVADWIIIEKDYRCGIKPLRLIAEENGITHGAINKRAKRDGWTRDLAAKIKAKAEDKVSKAAVSAVVSAQSLVTENQVVEANAELQYRIRMEHRADIKRSRDLMKSLLSELEVTTDNRDLFEQLGELLDESGPDSNGVWRKDKQNEIYMKVISLTGRTDNSKKVVEMLEKLVRLEREAFGITDGGAEKGGVEDMLKSIGRKLQEQGVNG